MKKRILFVDDEPLVLEGLRHMLHGMRKEWDMLFVESGVAALGVMEDNAVDVVVSDMRMPGMNGAQLLNEVMKRSPRTVRLILSGHADQELILKCVGSTHQYLAKPCDPDALRATVSRAIELETSLKNERLQRLIAQMEHLPSIPSLYVEIVEQANDPEASLSAVGDIIARDIGMTAKILKLVNSAFFALRRVVASPTEAVSYLGLDTIKALVLSLNVFSQLEAESLGGFSMDALWTHSLSTAAVAKRIAQMEAADGGLAEEAFVSGLLHDAGKAALAFNFPADYGQALRGAMEQDLDPLVAEQNAFGATHAEVGGYLLGLWGLPVPVVEAIAFHHQPLLARQRTFTPLTAVHVADALMHENDRSAWCPAVDGTYLENLGLADRLEDWRPRCRPVMTLGSKR
jgi:HD-like signal output (HDOD) protein